MIKKYLLVAAFSLAAISTASAQTATAGAVSGSSSGAYNGGINYAPYSKVGNQIPGASGVYGNAASSPYKCKDVGGIGVPYFSLAVPISDEDCGPLVAAMAWDACRSDVCRATMTQNRYIKKTVDAMAEQRQQAVAVQTPRAQYASTSAPVVVAPRSGKPPFCANPQTYNAALCN